MRKPPTPSEAILWEKFRHGRLGARFRHRHPLGDVILELYAPGVKLAEPRQVTRLTDDGHQTPIITSRVRLRDVEVAFRMFARWSQENFFKYLSEEYALDALVDYRVEPDDPAREVPGPRWNALDAKPRRAREIVGHVLALYGVAPQPTARACAAPRHAGARPRARAPPPPRAEKCPRYQPCVARGPPPAPACGEVPCLSLPLHFQFLLPVSWLLLQRRIKRAPSGSCRRHRHGRSRAALDWRPTHHAARFLLRQPLPCPIFLRGRRS